MREALDFLLGLVALAALTALCFWLNLPLVSVSFTFLILIVLFSLRASFISSAALSIAAVGCLNYLFAPPIFNLRADLPEDILTVTGFLISSLIVTLLVARQKRTERALRRSEAYLADAQKLSHTGSFAYDVAKRRITYSSEEHLRLFGFDPAAVVPHIDDWVRRVHPGDRERVVQIMEQVVRERTGYEVEYRIVHPDGTIKFVHSVGHPALSPSGDLVEVAGTVTDITDRKREEYLTEQVSERLPDLVSVIGRDYRYRRANPTYERVWSIPVENVVGMHVGDVVGKATFDRVVKPNLDRCFAGEEVSFGEWFDNPGGRRYWVVTYSPLQLNSERVDHALAVARDLTEQTLAAERLRDARIELAHVNRVATIGQLTASIAHEVNQPIGALVTNAHAAMRMLSAESPNLSEAREALGDIIKDGRRVSDVIRHIRALVKRAPAQADLFDINEVITETIALARSEILRNGVTLETPRTRDLPPI